MNNFNYKLIGEYNNKRTDKIVKKQGSWQPSFELDFFLYCLRAREYPLITFSMAVLVFSNLQPVSGNPNASQKSKEKGLVFQKNTQHTNKITNSPQVFFSATGANNRHITQVKRQSSSQAKTKTDVKFGIRRQDIDRLKMSEEMISTFSSNCRDRIKKNLSDIFNEELMSKLYKEGVGIYLRPLCISPGASYAPNIPDLGTPHTIYIGIDSDATHISNQMIKNQLKNELFHAALRHAKKTERNNQFGLTETQAKQMDTFIQIGENRFHDMEIIFQNYLKEKQSQQTPELNKFFKALESYYPHEIMEAHTKTDFQNNFKNFPNLDKGLYLKANTLQMKTKSGSSYNPVDFILKFVKNPFAEYVIYINSPVIKNEIDKAKMFFFNENQRKSLHRDPTNVYGNKSKIEKIEEKASEIAMLPHRLLQLFYPEFYNFCNEIFEVKNFALTNAPVQETDCTDESGCQPSKSNFKF